MYSPGIEAGTYYKREVASSLLADVLGFDDLVPKTTFREWYGKQGSMQQYVPDTRTAKRTPTAKMYDGDEDLARGALFDYITGNVDRHHGNWLITGGGNLVLIDNGLSMPGEYNPKTYGFLTRGKSQNLTVAGGDKERKVSSNMEMIRESVLRNLPMPDVSHMADRWPDVEHALRSAGVDDQAIALTKQRFDVIVSGRYQRIRDLPAYWQGKAFQPSLRSVF